MAQAPHYACFISLRVLEFLLFKLCDKTILITITMRKLNKSRNISRTNEVTSKTRVKKTIVYKHTHTREKYILQQCWNKIIKLLILFSLTWNELTSQNWNLKCDLITTSTQYRTSDFIRLSTCLFSMCKCRTMLRFYEMVCTFTFATLISVEKINQYKWLSVSCNSSFFFANIMNVIFFFILCSACQLDYYSILFI